MITKISTGFYRTVECHGTLLVSRMPGGGRFILIIYSFFNENWEKKKGSVEIARGRPTRVRKSVRHHSFCVLRQSNIVLPLLYYRGLG